MRSAESKKFPFKIYVRLFNVCIFRSDPVSLGVFDNSFIEYLFELVEQTRYMHDETFNYSVIKLIVSLPTRCYHPLNLAHLGGIK